MLHACDFLHRLLRLSKTPETPELRVGGITS